jgi:hypothetical protein
MHSWTWEDPEGNDVRFYYNGDYSDHVTIERHSVVALDHRIDELTVPFESLRDFVLNYLRSH